MDQPGDAVSAGSAAVRGGGRRRALVVPAGVAALAGTTLVLDLVTPEDGPGVELAAGWGTTYSLLGLLLAALGAVVLRHDPRQRFGHALQWLGVFWVLDGLAQSYVRYGIREDGALPFENAALWFLNRFGAFLPVTVAALLLIFPTGRFLAGRWGSAGRVVLGAMVATALLVIVAPSDERMRAVDLPPGVDVDAGTLPFPDGFTDRVLPLGIAVALTGLLVAMASVVVRYRRAGDLDRDRLRWLLWSLIAMLFVVALGQLTEMQAVEDLVVFVVVALPSVAMTVGIVRPGLVPIDELVSATVVYGLLSVALVGLDLLALAGLTAALDDSLDQRQVVVVVLALTALVYLPLRRRLARLVRRLVLGGRADRYDAVAGLAASLETADEGTEQLAAVARAVGAAFGVGFVAVEVDRAGGETLVATYGDRPAQTRTLPIAYRGDPVGRLVLPARGLRTRLGRRDERLLGDLVRQAATAARTSRLATELQHSRERLVTAREEERRRIRRDLHDGLGPALSGVVFQLESARLLVDRDPDGARSRIAATSAHVQDVVADVRRLVHDLRPPALDDRGLVGALRQQAEQVAGVDVRVVADDLGALPAAVEVAAYRIVGEALTNVVRHARATTCRVRLARRGADDGREGGSELLVEVVDDGVGIDPEAQAGVGLVSLRERAAELGGRSEVTCPVGGGTVVRARLPVAARTEQHESPTHRVPEESAP